jgi:regulator of sigma E protease
MTILSYVLAFLVAIGVLVAVHEYGHFWMARRLGIRVLRFSIGFGRPLWSRRGADGTEYAVAAIPLGGYVKLLDEREGPIDPGLVSEAFNRKPVWARILVLLAGPLANFLFAVAAYWVLFVAGVPALKPVVGDVAAESTAARAGLRPGDEILRVGSKDTGTREEAVLALIDELMNGVSGDLEMRGDDGRGDSRQVRLDVAGDLRALTEPGALLPGLGFDFWYPAVPDRVGKVLFRQSGGACRPARRRRDPRGGRRAGRGFPGAGGVRTTEARARRLDVAVERDGGTLSVPIEVEAQREGERLDRSHRRPACGIGRSPRACGRSSASARSAHWSTRPSRPGHVGAHGAHDLERRHRRRLGQEPERPDQHRGVRRFLGATGHTCRSFPSWPS